MNQESTIGIGSDITVAAGYVNTVGDRLGALDLMFENTGLNTATLRLQAHDGSTSPSGYVLLGSTFTVVAGGTLTKSLVLLNKEVGLFGSGNTKVNMSVNLRNKADLRGAEIFITGPDRRGWTYDDATNKAALRPNWGGPPDAPTELQGDAKPTGS